MSKAWVCLSAAGLLLLAAVASAGPAKFASAYVLSAGLTADDREAQAMMEKAIDQVLASFGADKPKLIVFTENTRHTGGIRKGMAHAAGVPIMGVDSGGYPPLGLGAFQGQEWNKEQKHTAISLLAIGGDVSVQTAVIEEKFSKPWEWWDKARSADGTPFTKDQKKDAEAKAGDEVAGWGEKLAQQLKPADGKTNLFLQMGAQHTPINFYVTEGAKRVYPTSVHYWGAASANFGGIYQSATQYKPTSLLGIMISGDFKVIEAGSPEEDGAKQVGQWRAKMESALAESGDKPAATLIVGCAGWCNHLPDKEKITTELLAGLPVFGTFGGGEIGHYQTSGPVASKPGQLFITMIKN